jgi:hypothetical protein
MTIKLEHIPDPMSAEELKREFRQYVLYRAEGRIMSMPAWDGEIQAGVKAYIRDLFADAMILNDLPIDEAVAVFNAQALKAC